ncbi:S8 family peptidase [Pseudonocardia sp. RS010]|uniref:S8 family peptidase n=1 Tax=Pseudonocardia sp. RS010 TaxID=3385979 RepID=UPI0039A3C75B
MTEPSGQSTGGRILVNGEQMAEVVDRARGGGEKYHPYTFEQTQARLGSQTAALATQARTISVDLRADRVVFEAKLLPNYLANSYFPDRLADLLDLVPLGSRPATGTLRVPSGSSVQPTKTLIVASDERGLDRLNLLIQNGPRTRSEQAAADELRQFELLRLPTVEEILGRAPEAPSDNAVDLTLYEAVLHPDPDSTSSTSRRRLSSDTYQKFVALVNRHGGEVIEQQADVVGGLTFVPVRLHEDELEAVAAFNPLRSLRRMPRIRPVPAFGLRSATRVNTSPPPPPDPSAPEVLVFDAGVDGSSPLFSGAVSTEDLTSKTPAPGCLHHGSAVTAAILFGEVAPGQQLDQPKAQVRHFRAIPGHDTDVSELYWLLDRIKEKVEDSNAGIVNLSLGPEVAVEDEEPHRWTAVLDELAYERDVLFVSAAGNNGESDQALGLNRVQVPGDMVNGLTIGACDTSEHAEEWTRPAYSAVGPGRAGLRISPSVVAFGGSDENPFNRMYSDGRITYDCGTSYSAPLVVHNLAKLATELGDRSNAATLRAFAAHFAEPHSVLPKLEVGHGRIHSNFAGNLDCAANEVTVLYQGVIESGEVIAYQLPVPEQLDRGKVQIRWTLSYLSPTDPTEAAEYTKIGLESTLRPHAAMYSFRDPEDAKTQRKVDILNDQAEVAELLKIGWRQSQNPVSRSKGSRATEASLRADGKWETLACLNDSMLAKSLWRPRLDISQISREGGTLARDSAPPLEFALLVTVRSQAGLPVYTQTLSEFPILAALPVATEVEVEL